MRDDPLLKFWSLSQCNYDLDDAKTVLIDTHLVQVLVDLFKDKLLVFVIEAATLEDFADDMCTLLIN